jgi:anti-sigma regulatory factor (Ser/Thr protein kinase)
MIRRAIAELTRELGWNDSESLAITLAVEEALTNKIRHAYHGRTDGKIMVGFRTEPGTLVFELTDQGDAPATGSICSRDKTSQEPGGRGTHIMRDVMDKVVYQTVESGNQVIMTKVLPAAKRQQGTP